MNGGTLLPSLLAAPPALSVGIISADLMHLGQEVARLEQAGARLLHFDVMDGCLVPLLTVGPAFIQQVRSTMLKDVHLMVDQPLEKVKQYVAAGADLLTVHVESCSDLRPVLQRIGELFNANDPSRGVLRGVALFPDTPLESLEPLLDHCDLVTLLAVDPRYNTASPLEAVAERVQRLQEMLAGAASPHLICVDGGVKRENIETFARMNARFYVSGSAVFKGECGENLRVMQEAVQGGLAVSGC